MSTPEHSPYPLGEALALLAPVVGCPVEQAQDYTLVVFGQGHEAHVGASERMPPPVAARVLLEVVKAMGAGQ